VTAPANTEAITYALSQVGLDVTVTATTQAPNVIAPTEGWTIAQDRLSATYSVTVLPARNDCPVTPATPTITAQPVCTGPGTSSPGSFDLPESTDVVTYTTEGDVVTATTHAPYLFSATEGWTISEDRLTATYTVTFTSAGDCLVEVVPVLPTVAVSASCGLEGTYTIPEVEGITYLLDGEPVAADTYEGPAAGTITVTANQGYVLPDVEWSFALDLAPAEACPVIVLVTPVDPQVTQSATCEVEGSYTVPTTAGVLYLLDGESIEAGTYPGPAAGTITAAPIEGTELVDAAWSFDLALTAAADCADSNGPLPQTGAAVTALGTVGALGLLVGVLLMVLGARRREDETQV
jgi:LPXTG-motif cell wall-anchored protein